MKTFTLLFILATLFAACETVEPPVGVDSTADDKYYTFDAEIISEGITEEGDISCLNKSPEDSPWTVGIVMRGTAAGTEAVEIIVEQEGYFEYAFVHDWFIGGYTDTIIGTGYFDADTAYLNYTYQPMNDDGSLYSEPKEVVIHSL